LRTEKRRHGQGCRGCERGPLPQGRPQGTYAEQAGDQGGGGGMRDRSNNPGFRQFLLRGRPRYKASGPDLFDPRHSKVSADLLRIAGTEQNERGYAIGGSLNLQNARIRPVDSLFGLSTRAHFFETLNLGRAPITFKVPLREKTCGSVREEAGSERWRLILENEMLHIGLRNALPARIAFWNSAQFYGDRMVVNPNIFQFSLVRLLTSSMVLGCADSYYLFTIARTTRLKRLCLFKWVEMVSVGLATEEQAA
jgi:hypothetical protein